MSNLDSIEWNNDLYNIFQEAVKAAGQWITSFLVVIGETEEDGIVKVENEMESNYN